MLLVRFTVVSASLPVIPAFARMRSAMSRRGGRGADPCGGLRLSGAVVCEVVSPYLLGTWSGRVPQPPARGGSLSLMAADSISPEHLTRLFHAAAEVVEQRDLNEVLLTIMTTARDLTGARHAAVGVVGSHGGLRDFLHTGLDTKTVEAIGNHPVGVGLLGAITDTHSVTRLDSVADHPHSAGYPSGHPPMNSFIGVALRTGDRVFGNLYLTDKEGGFDESDELTIAALAAVGGAAASTAELRERLGELALAEDRERIARDVHDGVIQDIFAIGLGLQNAVARSSGEVLRDQAVGAVEKLNDCIVSLRSVIYDLRHSVRPSDLATEIADLIEELGEAYNIAPTLRLIQPPPPLGEREAETVMAIVKEAVSNALRHSNGQSVEVTLDSRGGHMLISIRDDGAGFDRDEVVLGMGLTNMERRAMEAGGTITIDSTPDTGTEIRVEIPQRG